MFDGNAIARAPLASGLRAAPIQAEGPIARRVAPERSNVLAQRPAPTIACRP